MEATPQESQKPLPYPVIKKRLSRLSIKVQTVKTKYSIIFCIALVTAFQTTGHIKYESSRKACCASILTYCATHTLPHLCTPTSVSCLSLEPFSTVHQTVENNLFPVFSVPSCARRSGHRHHLQRCRASFPCWRCHRGCPASYTQREPFRSARKQKNSPSCPLLLQRR